MRQQSKKDILGTDQVADIIIKYPQLLKPVLRIGIYPSLGNTTLQEACCGKSMDLELSLEVLRLTIDPRHKPASLSRYSLLPLVEYYCKSLSSLKPWLNTLDLHLKKLTETQKEDIGFAAVTKFYENYSNNLMRFISGQEHQLKETLTQLYELFYSPVYTDEDIELAQKALTLTNKEEGEAPSSEIEDIISLLLRHTKLPESPILYCGIMQQLNDIKNTIESLNAIRAKLLYPMVNDMVRQVKKRKQETEA